MAENTKSDTEVFQVENAVSASTEEQLIRQGEELEAVEKTMPFWTAFKTHKIIIFYRKLSQRFPSCSVN